MEWLDKRCFDLPATAFSTTSVISFLDMLLMAASCARNDFFWSWGRHIKYCYELKYIQFELSWILDSKDLCIYIYMQGTCILLFGVSGISLFLCIIHVIIILCCMGWWWSETYSCTNLYWVQLNLLSKAEYIELNYLKLSLHTDLKLLVKLSSLLLHLGLHLLLQLFHSHLVPLLQQHLAQDGGGQPANDGHSFNQVHICQFLKIDIIINQWVGGWGTSLP